MYAFSADSGVMVLIPRNKTKVFFVFFEYFVSLVLSPFSVLWVVSKFPEIYKAQL